MKIINNLAHAVILSAALFASKASAVTVEVGIDQLSLIYADSKYANEITGGSLQVGRLGIAEAGLMMSNRTTFDAFLADNSRWLQYGATATYLPNNLSATYTFTNNFEPFVQGWGSVTVEIIELPYQLYFAVTSGTNLFGLFTWRGTDGSVSRFARTSDDAPVLSFANEAFVDGRLNLESVTGYGSVRVLNGSVDSAVALIPEPSTGLLVVLGLSGLLLKRRKTGTL